MTLTAGVRIDSAPEAPHWDVIVVGAGLGGLSTAAFLATNGKRVLVLEQARVVGGCSQVFRRLEDRYEFDVGAHHVGECHPGGRVRTVLGALGIDDRVEWCQLDPDGFSTITLPGLEFRVPVGWDAYEERLVETFPAEAKGVRRCLRVLRAAAREVQAPQRPGALGQVGHVASSPTLLRWGHRPLASLLEACGLSPEARAVVAGECGEYAAPPSRAPVAVHAGLLDHYLTSGAWYPRGGGQIVPARLTQVVLAHGGEVRTGARVDRILVEGGRAVGVTLVDGEELHADAVVSNADPKRTYLGLVGREHLSPRLLRRAEKMVPALPLFTVHLALDVDLRDRLPSSRRWILPHPDLEASYAAAYAGRIGGPVPVLMTSGTVKDPSGTRTAPPGHSTLELVTVAPAQHSTWGLRAGGPTAGEHYSHEEAYLAAKERLLEAVVRTAETVIPDLRQRVVHQEAWTPVTHERFTLAWSGTAHGLEVARDQVGPFRPDVTTPIPGLHLAGVGTRNMPGIASAIDGGVATAGAILGRDLHAELAAGKRYAAPGAVPADGPEWDPLVVSEGGPAVRRESPPAPRASDA